MKKLLIIILSIVVVSLVAYFYALSVNGGNVAGASEYATLTVGRLALAAFFGWLAIRTLVGLVKGKNND